MTDTPIENSIKALHYARTRNKEAQGANGECPDKAALAQQGEPVAWQSRISLDGSFSEWKECSLEMPDANANGEPPAMQAARAALGETNGSNRT